MATTTNFGWETPDDTDLVKDGAAAMRTLGNSIDTSFVDLKGGTTGQILSKASNTDLDYAWITNDVGDITAVTAGTGISGGGTTGAVTITNSMATTIDDKGDLIGGTGADTFARLAVGSNGQVLTADSAETTGLKWATPSAGSFTLITRNSFSNVAGVNIDSIFSSTYKTYLVMIEKIYPATYSDDILLQMRYGSSTESGSSYYGNRLDATYNSTTLTTNSINGTTSFALTLEGGSDANPTMSNLYFDYVGNTSQKARFWGQAMNTYEIRTSWLGCSLDALAQTYTGIRLSSSSSNITGIVSVYGLATS